MLSLTSNKMVTNELAEGLLTKYKRAGGTGTLETRVHEAFDLNKLQGTGREAAQKLSQTPKLQIGEVDIGSTHRRIGELQLEMADYAQEYGELSVKFGDLIGQKSYLGFADMLKLGFTFDKTKKRNIHLDAMQKKGTTMQTLVGKIAEVIGTQHQRSVELKDQAYSIQTSVVDHMKNLDRRLIDHLKSGVGTGIDLAAANTELISVRKELSDVDAILSEYEQKIEAARAGNDLKLVISLSDDMSKFLDVKYEIIDRQRSFEGTEREIRRGIYGSAEGVQSAKGALAASRANYQATSTLIDAMNELEIKYRNMKDDMIPVFLHQASIAATGLEATDMKKAIEKAAIMSNQLMGINADIVMNLGNEVAQLLMTPVYDMNKAKEIEERMMQYRVALNEVKDKWAQNVTTIVNPTSQNYTSVQ